MLRTAQSVIPAKAGFQPGRVPPAASPSLACVIDPDFAPGVPHPHPGHSGDGRNPVLSGCARFASDHAANSPVTA